MNVCIAYQFTQARILFYRYIYTFILSIRERTKIYFELLFMFEFAHGNNLYCSQFSRFPAKKMTNKHSDSYVQMESNVGQKMRYESVKSDQNKFDFTYSRFLTDFKQHTVNTKTRSALCFEGRNSKHEAFYVSIFCLYWIFNIIIIEIIFLYSFWLTMYPIFRPF